jgi:hypothetical protein
MPAPTRALVAAMPDVSEFPAALEAYMDDRFAAQNVPATGQMSETGRVPGQPRKFFGMVLTALSARSETLFWAWRIVE